MTRKPPEQDAWLAELLRRTSSNIALVALAIKTGASPAVVTRKVVYAATAA